MLDKIIEYLGSSVTSIEKLGDHLNPLQFPSYIIFWASCIGILLATSFASSTGRWTVSFVPLGVIAAVFMFRVMLKGIASKKAHGESHCNFAAILGLVSSILALSIAVESVNLGALLNGNFKQSRESFEFGFYWFTCAICLIHMLLVLTRYTWENWLHQGLTRASIAESSLVGTALLWSCVYLMTTLYESLQPTGISEYNFKTLLLVASAQPRGISFVFFHALWLLFAIMWISQWLIPEPKKKSKNKKSKKNN